MLMERLCSCKPTAIGCSTRKDWLLAQIGVWRVSYEKRDIRKKTVHPSVFPIQLSKRVISLFSHEGELVVDPFVGSGTTLIAARDLNRNAIGFDLNQKYIDLCVERLLNEPEKPTYQIPLCENALNAPQYLGEGEVKLIWTSPPYADMLTLPRKNATRRNPKDEIFNKVVNFSDDPNDLGNMDARRWTAAMGDIFEGFLPTLTPDASVVINVIDFWRNGRRVLLHMFLTNELQKRGYRLKNIIVWDKTNLTNGLSSFGYPSNYITMGITFEFLLHFVVGDADMNDLIPEDWSDEEPEDFDDVFLDYEDFRDDVGEFEGAADET